MDFDQMFSSEQKCLDYLMAVRWPNGPVCPACYGQGHWKMSKGVFSCQKCRHQTSPTANTIFHASRKPLTTWFRAIWWMVAQKSGVSALGLQRILGLGSYRTAWLWLHKFRRLFVIPGREPLSGVVEVDETYVGGGRPGRRGRGAAGKSLVVIGVEKVGRKIGRVRMARISNANKKSLEGFITANIKPGTVIITDKWNGYRGLPDLGFVHETEDETYCFDGDSILPNVHRIVALLKRWLLGTHQNFVSPENLDYYLDEFTFRHNRRNAKTRGLLFKTLLEQAVNHFQIPYYEIEGNTYE